jgi:hypothetical protein
MVYVLPSAHQEEKRTYLAPQIQQNEISGKEKQEIIMDDGKS